MKADNQNAFTIGSIGFCDQDCDFLDYTYVQLNSSELNQRVNQDISIFCDGIRNNECNKVNYHFTNFEFIIRLKYLKN